MAVDGTEQESCERGEVWEHEQPGGVTNPGDRATAKESSGDREPSSEQSTAASTFLHGAENDE